MSNIKIVTEQKTIEAVKKAVGGGQKEDRKVYDSLEQAVAAFQAASQAAGEDFPAFIAPESAFYEPVIGSDGQVEKDDQGNIVLSDELIGGLNYAVSVVGARARNAEGKIENNGIKAIVCWPMPKIEVFLESDAGTDWIRKIIEKEAAHVAFRGLRNAETLDEFEAAFSSIPMSVEAVVSTHIGAGGLDTDAFDAIWPEFRASFKEDQPKLAGHLPPKQDVIKAIRSKAYAEQEYAALEKLRLFEWIGKKMVEAGATWTNDAGELDPIDTKAIQGWVEGRETLDLSRKQLAAEDIESITLQF